VAVASAQHLPGSCLPTATMDCALPSISVWSPHTGLWGQESMILSIYAPAVTRQVCRAQEHIHSKWVALLGECNDLVTSEQC